MSIKWNIKEGKKANSWRDCLSVFCLSVPLCPLSLSLYWHKCLLDTWLCVPGVVVHQFVGSALFAAGNLHHHFNQQGSASSPKHSATIGKPRGYQHSPAQAATSCRPDSRPHYHTVCLSCCWYDGLLSCTLKAAVPLSTQLCGNTHICGLKHICMFIMTHTVVLKVTHLS